MSCLLFNIKSKYSLENIFDYTGYKLCLKLIKISKKLLIKLGITQDSYRIFFEINRLITSSYDFNKYFNFLEENSIKKPDELSNIYEKNKKIINEHLNNIPLNINLNIENKNFQFLVNNINRLNLIISPNTINYIYNLDYKSQINIFNLLRKYKYNLVEITFNNFINKMKINSDISHKIIYILENIFDIKVKNSYIKENDIFFNNEKFIIKINKNKNKKNINKNNIKKISFQICEIISEENILFEFLNCIDEILSLNTIEELNIDCNSFINGEYFYIGQFICDNMLLLKSIKFDNLFLLDILPNVIGNLEKLDLSNIFCDSQLISTLVNKNFPLKEFKLKMYSNELINNIYFFKSNIIFEIEIIIDKKNKDDENIHNLFINLNKIKKLKGLKINGSIEPIQLFDFNNKLNIEYLYLDIYLPYNNLNFFPVNLYNYFEEFTNLKLLSLTKKDSVIQSLNFDDIIFNFVFPPKLRDINLYNLDGNIIISLLNENKNHLQYIGKLKIENSKFSIENIENLLKLIISFKSLVKLSFNKINIEDKITIGEDESDINSELYYKISSILKNIQSFNILMNIDNREVIINNGK